MYNISIGCIYNFLVSIKEIARVILAVVIIGITVFGTEACSGGSEHATTKSPAATAVVTTAPATSLTTTTAAACAACAAGTKCKNNHSTNRHDVSITPFFIIVRIVYLFTELLNAKFSLEKTKNHPF